MTLHTGHIHDKNFQKWENLERNLLFHFNFSISQKVFICNSLPPGIPIAVVCTKVDSMTTLEKDLDYTDSYFDLIQWHLRKFALKYGAGLFYLNGKESPNTDVLYK